MKNTNSKVISHIILIAWGNNVYKNTLPITEAEDQGLDEAGVSSAVQESYTTTESSTPTLDEKALRIMVCEYMESY